MARDIDQCSIAFRFGKCNGVCTPSGSALVQPITPGVDYRHKCFFCGWERASDTPVMLSPCCDLCGCALDAVLAPTASAATGPAFALSRGASLALRWAAVLSALLAFYAAAKLGYEGAGASGALIAFGVCGFLLLPFVPERV
jgi:hypothetical protein